jgi:hypothetical protein
MAPIDILNIGGRDPYTRAMAWGRLVQKATPGPPSPATPRPAPLLAAGALLAVAGIVALLVDPAGWGPTWPVVLVGAVGAAISVRIAHLPRRTALMTMVAVALAGMGWIELVNIAQYGTLSLSGPPPLIRWCGATYQKSAVVVSTPPPADGARDTMILRTPSGYDVFGVAPPRTAACGAQSTLSVEVGTARFIVYDRMAEAPPPTQPIGRPAPIRPS